MTTGVVIFYIVVGSYLAGLLVYTLIKRHKHKKKVQQEIKQDEQVKEQNSSNEGQN